MTHFGGVPTIDSYGKCTRYQEADESGREHQADHPHDADDRNE